MVVHHALMDEHDMEVELTLFPLEKGGRIPFLPIQTDADGPRIYFDGEEWLAVFTLQDREQLLPGETARAFVTVAETDCLIGKLFPGKEFLLRVGCYPTGKGRILSFLHFAKHAEEARQQAALLADPNQTPIPPHWERPRHRPRKKKNQKK